MSAKGQGDERVSRGLDLRLPLLMCVLGEETPAQVGLKGVLPTLSCFLETTAALSPTPRLIRLSHKCRTWKGPAGRWPHLLMPRLSRPEAVPCSCRVLVGEDGVLRGRGSALCEDTNSWGSPTSRAGAPQGPPEQLFLRHPMALHPTGSAALPLAGLASSVGPGAPWD